MRERLLKIFAADEPDYQRAAAMGPAALPVLCQMVEEGFEVAASAVYVAALIAERGSVEIMAKAARREDDVRAHAAYALYRFVSRAESYDVDAVSEILAPLLDDEDPDVRRFAQRAAAALPDGVHHHAGRNAGS